MIIALIGNDGSGKSTLKSDLVGELSKTGKVVALEEFDYPLLRLMRKIAGNKTAQLQKDIQQTKPTLMNRLMPYIMLWDSSWQIVLRRLFRRKTIFVKDRCLYDYLATWREIGVASKVVEFLYMHAPRPDVTFYIAVDAKTSLQRRKAQPQKDSGKSLEFYELKESLYKDIYAKNSITLIDNQGSRNEALQSILHYLTVRATFKKLRQVALSGLDGAGKTTTMENLSELLTRLNIPHKTVHFYYNYLPVRLLKAIKPKKTVSNEDAHQKSVDNEKQAVAKGKSRLWMRIVLADAMIQYAFYRLINFNKVLLFDRFFPDYMVSFDFLKVDYSREVLAKVFPKTDLYFLQIADYKVLYERKPEHTIDFFRECYDKYRQLADEQKMIILDSTKNTPDIILHQLVSAAIGQGDSR